MISLANGVMFGSMILAATCLFALLFYFCNPSRWQSVRERMRSLDDQALLRLVAVEAAAYRPEAVEIACEELKRRRLDVLTREQYWSRFPAERVGAYEFCATCRAQTTDESPGDTSVVNFVFGTRLIGHDRCLSCGSVLQTKWLQYFLPIIPLGTYRIIYLERGLMSGRYIGRRVRGENTAG